MSQILSLSEPIYNALMGEVAELGISPEGWIAAHLLTRPPKSPPSAKTLADEFAGRIGRFASDPPSRLSENASQAFGDILEQQHREGR